MIASFSSIHFYSFFCRFRSHKQQINVSIPEWKFSAMKREWQWGEKKRIKVWYECIFEFWIRIQRILPYRLRGVRVRARSRECVCESVNFQWDGVIKPVPKSLSVLRHRKKKSWALLCVCIQLLFPLPKLLLWRLLDVVTLIRRCAFANCARFVCVLCVKCSDSERHNQKSAAETSKCDFKNMSELDKLNDKTKNSRMEKEMEKEPSE